MKNQNNRILIYQGITVTLTFVSNLHLPIRYLNTKYETCTFKINITNDTVVKKCDETDKQMDREITIEHAQLQCRVFLTCA